MKKVYLILSALALFIASCQQPEKVESLPQSEVNDVLALKVASNHDVFMSLTVGENVSNKNARVGDIKKNLKAITPIKDEKGNISFFVITYKEGGFVLVSAEKKTIPILAYSDKNDFRLDANLPASINNVIEYYKKGINEARVKNLPVEPSIQKAWERLEDTSSLTEWVNNGRKGNMRISTEPEGPGCQDEVETVPELLPTHWGQGCGYNAQMPSGASVGLSCTPPFSSPLPCSNVFVGCVPLSIGQVMRYHQFPNTFNYSIMANNVSSTEGARMLRDIANNVAPGYDCGGTWASQASIRNTLLGYGYSTGMSDLSYNVNTVKNELRAGRPVILTGIDPSVNAGHAWVCEGFLDYYSCSGDIFHGLRMNWGWEGNADGLYQSFNPGSNNFSNNQRMVIGIRP